MIPGILLVMFSYPHKKWTEMRVNEAAIFDIPVEDQFISPEFPKESWAVLSYIWGSLEVSKYTQRKI